MKPTDDELVSVPKALLKEVLEEAENDSISMEGEYASSAEHHARYEAAREKINRLRSYAGINGD